MRKPRLAVVAKKSNKRENRELDALPIQRDEDICLYDTDVRALVGAANSAECREGLRKLKKKFLWEIQEWSKRFGVKTDVRVYFTLKPED